MFRFKIGTYVFRLKPLFCRRIERSMTRVMHELHSPNNRVTSYTYAHAQGKLNGIKQKTITPMIKASYQFLGQYIISHSSRVTLLNQIAQQHTYLR